MLVCRLSISSCMSTLNLVTLISNSLVLDSLEFCIKIIILSTMTMLLFIFYFFTLTFVVLLARTFNMILKYDASETPGIAPEFIVTISKFAPSSKIFGRKLVDNYQPDER